MTEWKLKIDRYVCVIVYFYIIKVLENIFMKLLFKAFLSFSFALQRTHNNKWFTGPQLISLLDLVLFLPEGAETDLLQNSDR